MPGRSGSPVTPSRSRCSSRGSRTKSAAARSSPIASNGAESSRRRAVYNRRAMNARAGWSTPMLHVAEVERSIRFYRLLGFELVDVESEPGCPPGWARLHTADGSAIMLLCGEAEHPVKPELQGIMLVLYTDGLVALREQLLAAGERPTEIERPPWMPSGHFMLRDPDGYGIGANQWGDKQHQAWLKQIEQKRAQEKSPNRDCSGLHPNSFAMGRKL